MLRTLIVLPDGTEVFSGPGTKNAIRSSTVTECVNSDTELRPGSVCSTSLECSIINPLGGLSISAGGEVELYKVDSAGARHKVGLFTCKKTTRPSQNILKITAFDRVSWLDVDLTEWIGSLTEWPYRLDTLAWMTCEACGVTMVDAELTNGAYPVERPKLDGEITGRKLLGWLAEIAVSFCRATPDGQLEFAWYKSNGITLAPKTDRYYTSLRYEDYTTAPIDHVAIRLGADENASLWPIKQAANPYVLSGNEFLRSIGTDQTAALNKMFLRLGGQTYTPCEITAPASLDIHAGDILSVVDRNGNSFRTYVMEKTQVGQQDRIRCTGALSRGIADSADSKTYARRAAEDAVKGQTQEDIFNILTKNGEYQGIWLTDGKIYFNGEYLRAGTIHANNIGMDGKFSVFDGSGTLGGYLGYMAGATDTEVTNGIGVSDATEMSSIVATSAGAKIRNGSCYLYVMDGVGAVVVGDLTVKGNIRYRGNLEQIQ